MKFFVFIYLFYLFIYVVGQFHELETELIRRREECSQLRNVLVSNTEGLKSIAKSNYSPEIDLDGINEDGELVLAFEAQKKINRYHYWLNISDEYVFF